jgi:hypothetical protein
MIHGLVRRAGNTVQDRVDASLTQERVVALLAGFFGALAC